MSQPTHPVLAEPLAWGPPVLPRRRRRGLLLAVLAAVVVVAGGLVAVGVHLALAVGQDAAVAGADDGPPPVAEGLPGAGVPTPGLAPSAVPPPTAVLPPATRQPAGLGTDAALDGEAKGCFTGTMTACVQLYLASYRDPALARYTAYGDTCAGRQPAGTLRLCTASFPR